MAEDYIFFLKFRTLHQTWYDKLKIRSFFPALAARDRVNPIPGGYLKVHWMAALSLIRLQKEVKIASSRPE